MSEPDPTLDVDLLAAALRADASENEVFAEALAAKLIDLLPGGVRVERWRPRFRGPRQVRRIVVDTDGERLELRVEPTGLQPTRARVSGGITLKTEALEIDAWLRVLGAALAAQAARSRDTRQALERLLIQ